jgi:hypothetical protein
MKSNVATTSSEIPALRAGGDGLSRKPEEIEALCQAAYQTGYASGKKMGYRQGYKAGYANGRKQNNGSTPATRTSVISGGIRTSQQLLLGLPCTNCGAYFYSDEAQCPRCGTPRYRNPREADPVRRL